MPKTAELGRRTKVRSIVLLIAVFIIFTLAIVIPVIILSRIESVVPTKNSELKKMFKYFGVKEGIDVTWAHAVNSRAFLISSLEDPNLMMLEADVLLDPSDGKPIMAHPPENSSDLTLMVFLRATLRMKGKGVKLDMKEIQAIAPSLEILKQELNNASSESNNMPIMLNADVLVGPNNPKSPPLDAVTFFKLCQPIQRAIISPGWTTAWSNSANNSAYTWDMVREMETITRNLTQSVTFPVRASLATLSQEQLIWLLHKDPHRYSLTVWTSSSDKFNCDGLKYLRKFPQNVMFDLPPKLCDNLRML